MKLFLDDIRNPMECFQYMNSRIGKKSILYTENDWIIVRNYLEFTMALVQHQGAFEVISFDHDLSLEHYAPKEIWTQPDKVSERFDTFKEATGYECAQFSKAFYESNFEKHPEVLIHSMNPVGAERIKSLFK